MTAVLIPAMLLVQGCVSASTLAALTTALGNAAASIATIEGNSALAPKLQTDTAAAATAIANWKSGTPAQDAVEAINIVIDDLNLLPVAGSDAALVALALGTAESIIAILNPGGSSVTANVSVHAIAHTVHLKNAPKNAKQFKKMWNSVVAADPSLAAAELK